MTKKRKRWNWCAHTDSDLFSSFFFLSFCLIYIVTWSGTPDRAGVEMGNATQQLGANWRGIQHSLLPGRLGFYGTEMLLSDWLRGPTGSALSGRRRSTLWSHKGLHWSLEIANKKDGLCVCVCVSRSSQSGFTNFYPTDLILCFLFLSWIQVDGRFLEKENIYTHT